MAQRVQCTAHTNSEMFYSDIPMSVRPGVSRSEKCRSKIPKQKIGREVNSGNGAFVNNCGAHSSASRDLREPLTGSKGDSLMYRDFYPDNEPSIEINMNRQREKTTRSNSQTDSWGRILKTQSSMDTISSFNKFDPLRTIHFLGKELQSLLKSTIPHDSHVFEVLSEMQNALKRVPRDIQVIAEAAMKKHDHDTKPTKLASPLSQKISVIHESCQTPNMWYLEPIKLQQHLEESSGKIEKACQQMELLCTKLKSEKEALEEQLKIERESGSLLLLQIDDYKAKNNSMSSIIESLKSKNNELSLELQKQKIQLESKDSMSAVQLRSFIQDLQQQHGEMEAENEALKKQLQVAQMETEKYEAILQARDMQVKEIRQEMTQLQDVVNEQLYEFQNITSSEDVTHSIDTNITTDDQNWKETEKPPKTTNESDNPQPPSRTSEAVQELFNGNLDQYDGAQSADSTRASTITQVAEMNLDTNILTKRHVYKVPVEEINATSNLRERYLEMKNNGLTCAGTSA